MPVARRSVASLSTRACATSSSWSRNAGSRYRPGESRRSPRLAESIKPGRRHVPLALIGDQRAHHIVPAVGVTQNIEILVVDESRRSKTAPPCAADTRRQKSRAWAMLVARPGLGPGARHQTGGNAAGFAAASQRDWRSGRLGLVTRGLGPIPRGPLAARASVLAAAGCTRRPRHEKQQEPDFVLVVDRRERQQRRELDGGLALGPIGRAKILRAADVDQQHHRELALLDVALDVRARRPARSRSSRWCERRRRARRAEPLQTPYPGP